MMRKLLLAGAFSLALISAPAIAGDVYGSAPQMWGTETGGGVGHNGHYTNGLIAGQVKDARNGKLTGGTNIYQNYAIGTQINNSIHGNNSNITGSQTGSNSGDVTNKGTITGGATGNVAQQ